ncbi:uncharacterized protein F4812DRAFT_171374 [Daldinia caldariorum]|uniref:uncharacterized protein n=1 Tax=Daldinia caldariorum TaxID=326644 RepID=UPI0020088A99|nr:uncharacterized protein F4812DRAFT_171374 [Daldinia caldariorum]KAI1471251.1 hypothetical protein F4812DRAFT_171374 [Daldinia caldariorum]
MISQGSTITTTTEVTVKRKRVYRKTKCRKILSPQIGSLYDILHDYASTALYVPPLSWTELHTKVLGCRFVQQAPQTTPTPSRPSSPSSLWHSQPSKVPQTVVNISRALDVIMQDNVSNIEQNDAMKNVLEGLFPSQLSPTNLSRLTLRCGKDRYISAVRCQALYKDPVGLRSFESATTCSSDLLTVAKEKDTKASCDTPLLAYLDRDFLNRIRRNCYRIPPGPGGLFNGPIHRLQAIRSGKLVPKNLDEDHYILATMLAMAQQHVYGNVFTGEDFTPKDVQVRVLAVSKEDSSFVVYSSVIPTSFLAMFHEPGKSPKGDTKIAINYRHVPVWPVLGLKERLGQALGKDLIGEFDIDRIETFKNELVPDFEGLNSDNFEEDEEEEEFESMLEILDKEDRSMSNTSQLSLPPKRKRGIFSEVFNGSFSEDHESSGYPSELLAKRRRLEEGRVGVVR